MMPKSVPRRARCSAQRNPPIATLTPHPHAQRSPQSARRCRNNTAFSPLPHPAKLARRRAPQIEEANSTFTSWFTTTVQKGRKTQK